MLTAVDTSPVQTFVNALFERDFAPLERALHERVQFRALVPPGFRERDMAQSARELVEGWFGEADLIDVQYVNIEAIQEQCIHAGYRLRVREAGSWYVCEQHFFAHVAGGVIDSLDLICSGFRPVNET
jgi:hypothetical protein